MRFEVVALFVGGGSELGHLGGEDGEDAHFLKSNRDVRLGGPRAIGRTDFLEKFNQQDVL